MANGIWTSIERVCDVALVRGGRSRGEPDLLLEVPHGATRAADYDSLARELRGPFPADLRDFFFVNTDVGAPEVAQRIAELVVEAQPTLCAAVVRSRIPRTFVDCNRVIDASAKPSTSAAGQMTPGVHAWVRDAGDLELLLARYGAYRALVTDAFERVCGGGGLALMVHSYAPRSVDVPVDERIVESLRAAYAPKRVETWPLRAPVDLITKTPEGELRADAALVARVRAELASARLEVEENGAYALHPSTLAAGFAARYPGRTLCFEMRRDLIMREFTPFAEMHANPAKVERLASAFARALRASFAAKAP